MTSEKLYETLKLMIDLDEKLSLQASLTQIKDNLASLTNSPAATQHQNALASALSAFSDGADQLRKLIKPTEWGAIDELGGSEYFNPSIAEKVRTSIEHNAMTPSVARDFVQDIATRRANFLQTVKASLDGLTKLISPKKPKEHVTPADAAFTIPRELFDNRLGSFWKEIKFINELSEHLSEAVTGEVQPVELKDLSSSSPMIGVVMGLGILKLLGTVINSFLDAWEKVQKMRNLREQMKEFGISKTALEEATETITTTVDEVVEESTRLSLANYEKDGARKNELENILKRDLHRLFGQIERGLTVEIRTHENADVDESDKENLRAIVDTAQKMRFPAVSKEPILLTAGEVLDGEIVRTKVTTKKITTEKTSSKRQQHADKGSE